MNKDHYTVLGINKDATPEQITEAYRKQARKAHPDAAGGDKDQFKMIALAYEVLSDADTKNRYDRGEPVEKVNAVHQAVAILTQEAFMNSEDPLRWMRAKVNEQISNDKRAIAGNKKTCDVLTAKLGKLKRANVKCKNVRGCQFMIDTVNRLIGVGKEADVGLQKSIETHESVLLFIDNIEFPQEEYQPFSRPMHAGPGGLFTRSGWGSGS